MKDAWRGAPSAMTMVGGKDKEVRFIPAGKRLLLEAIESLASGARNSVDPHWGPAAVRRQNAEIGREEEMLKSYVEGTYRA